MSQLACAPISSSHGPSRRRLDEQLQARSSPTLTTAIAMLSRQAASRLSRPLIRLSSSSSVPAPPTSAKQVTPQAPNYPTTWSTTQAPRPAGQSGPRFEQTAMELQPNPLSAMEMVANEPIRVVHGRKAVCDGGTCMRPVEVIFHC